jgi:hypothetical protein
VPRGVGSIVTTADPPQVNSLAVAMAPDTDGPDCREAKNVTAAGPGENVGVGMADSPIGAILDPHPPSWTAAAAANTTSLTQRLVTSSIPGSSTAEVLLRLVLGPRPPRTRALTHQT